MDAKFNLKPIGFSWVSIHPNPIGVVQVIGGIFFGSFPSIFYRHLLRQLFDAGYTVIATPYQFTSNHWKVAIKLVKKRIRVVAAIKKRAEKLGYDFSIYNEDPKSRKANYFWVGHSVGCKYIALLELLADLETRGFSKSLGKCVGENQFKQIQSSLGKTDLADISIKNQPSVLLAPAITGIESAVPIRFLADLIKRIGLDVKPNVEETHCLIHNSNLFNLEGIVSYKEDNIARDTILWLKDNIRPAVFSVLSGGHLAPCDFSAIKEATAETTLEFLKKLRRKI